MSELKINKVEPLTPVWNNSYWKKWRYDYYSVWSYSNKFWNCIKLCSKRYSKSFKRYLLWKSNSLWIKHRLGNAIAGLNLTHQATSTNNRLLFLGQMVGALNPGGSSWIFRFVDRTNGTADTGNMNANAQGSRLRANSKCYIDNTSWGACNPMMAWVTPSSTDAIQYGVDVKHQHSDWAMNGNYDNSDSTTVDRSRGLSTFHILEFDSGIIKTG